MSLRIWLAVLGLLALVSGTLYLIGYDILAHNFVHDLRYLGIIAVVWMFSIPRIGQLRQMMTDQWNGRK